MGLELSLNEEKMRVIDARKQSFHFLGFTLEVKKNPKTGRMFPLITCKASMAEIKALTCRKTLGLAKQVVIRKLNELVRGWVGYFYYANCSRDLTKLKGFLDERVRTYPTSGGSMQRRAEAIKLIPTDIFTKLWDCTRYRRLPHGLKLRKPSEEDDRKTVFGKTERTV